MNTWIIDGAHSDIGFKIKHLVISTVRGNFKTFEGTIKTIDETFNGAEIQFSADIKSINTHNEDRDKHLAASDMFDAEHFPKLTFVSTSVTQTGEQLAVVGDLTLKGITKSIELSAIYNGTTVGAYGGNVAAFEVTGSINRQDFNLTWNKVLETGGMTLGDTVTFDMTIQAKQE